MKIVLALVLFSVSALGTQPLRVVTTTTDLAWAAKKIGGALVVVEPLLEGNENPHYVDALPEFIQKVANAQVVCVVGLDLEVGWIPKVLARSGNAQVQPGGTGYCDTGKAVSVLEKPTGAVNRSMGDVHPDGNPHFTLSPLALADAAVVIASTLGNVDPQHRKEYQLGLKSLQSELSQLRDQLHAQIKNALGKTEASWMEYHREFAYYFAAYDLKSSGSLEEKPGVPPSAGRIGEMAIAAKKAGVTALFATEYNPHKALDRFTELSGIPVLKLSIFPRKGSGLDYVGVQKKIADSISKLLAKRALTP